MAPSAVTSHAGQAGDGVDELVERWSSTRLTQSAVESVFSRVRATTCAA